MTPTAALGLARFEILDELREIFDGIDVVVRGRRYELHAGLRMAQACNQFRDLVAGKLATFAGLGALGDLDFEFLGVRRYWAVTPNRALATCLILLFSSEGAPSMGA